MLSFKPPPPATEPSPMNYHYVMERHPLIKASLINLFCCDSEFYVNIKHRVSSQSYNRQKDLTCAFWHFVADSLKWGFFV